MVSRGITLDEAYQYLGERARREGVSVNDVARGVVRSLGESS